MSLVMDLHLARKERLARMNRPPMKAAPKAVQQDEVAPPSGWEPKRYSEFRDLWFYMIAPDAAPPLLIEDIKRAVCKYYGISNVELTSNRRNLETTRPRQIAMYFAKKLSGKSMPEIGRRFGKRDHTTVLNAIRRIEKLCREDMAIAHDVAHLERELTKCDRRPSTNRREKNHERQTATA